MTPIDALIELLDRLGVSRGGPVWVNGEELQEWPSTAVKAMKSQRLLAKMRPAASAICPGCERECVMRVHDLSGAGGAQSSFIVCDKRSDVNRVLVPPERLIQWQCNADLICGFVATSLGLRAGTRKTDNAGRWEIGIFFGEKRTQMLCLEANEILGLVAGKNMVPLTELVEFREGKYGLNVAAIRRLVDAATTADNRYTPSNARRETRKLATQAMYQGWRKEYRALRRKRTGMSDAWYSLQIAKMEIACGRDAETIRKKMKK